MKVPDSLKSVLVGVPLNLSHKVGDAAVDKPGQVLRAPLERKKKDAQYSCDALDSAVADYLGEHYVFKLYRESTCTIHWKWKMLNAFG